MKKRTLTKNTIVTINDEKLKVRPLTFRTVIKLEEESGISLQDLSSGLSSKQMMSILFVALKEANPDSELTQDSIIDLDLSHELFSGDNLATILGNGDGNPLEQS